MCESTYDWLSCSVSSIAVFLDNGSSTLVNGTVRYWLHPLDNGSSPLHNGPGPDSKCE